jgi:hypothetical protein
VLGFAPPMPPGLLRSHGRSPRPTGGGGAIHGVPTRYLRLGGKGHLFFQSLSVFCSDQHALLQRVVRSQAPADNVLHVGDACLLIPCW